MKEITHIRKAKWRQREDIDRLRRHGTMELSTMKLEMTNMYEKNQRETPWQRVVMERTNITQTHGRKDGRTIRKVRLNDLRLLKWHWLPSICDHWWSYDSIKTDGKMKTTNGNMTSEWKSEATKDTENKHRYLKTVKKIYTVIDN